MELSQPDGVGSRAEVELHIEAVVAVSGVEERAAADHTQAGQWDHAGVHVGDEHVAGYLRGINFIGMISNVYIANRRLVRNVTTFFNSSV